MKNAKLENKTTVVKREWILWIMMGIVLLLSIYTNHYFSHQVIAIRLIGWIIAILILASLFFYTAIGRQFWVFAQASRAELRKVVWPTREETIRTTLIVIVMVIVAGLFLWAIDTLLLWAVAFLTA